MAAQPLDEHKLYRLDQLVEYLGLPLDAATGLSVYEFGGQQYVHGRELIQYIVSNSQCREALEKPF